MSMAVNDGKMAACRPPEQVVTESPAAAPSPAPSGQGPEGEVWQLLGRADVIVRAVLEAQDRAERRLWEERGPGLLQDLARAWLDTRHRSW